MTFGGDRRGVTVQVGAVLLLGVLVVGLSLYQATVVPSQNKQVEFDHSQTVQDQMVETRNAIVGTAGDGTTEPASVDLGVRYPPRTLFVNPPPARGTLRTVNTSNLAVNVTVRNATAVSPEVRDYWNGTRTVTYNTGELAYQPDYNVLENAPTVVYENTVVYNELSGGARARTDQTLVDGRQVTLVLVNGTLRESGVSATSVDPETLSVSTTTVSLRNDTSNVTVTVPTALPESEWDRTLGDEPAVAHDVVSGGPGGLDRLEITLFAGRTYELRVARIGVGDATDLGEAAYLTDVDGLTGPLRQDATEQFTVEVRDRYNNPVADVPVTANATSPAPTRAGEFETETGPASPTATVRSDADGRATFRFVPTNDSLTPTVNVTIDDGASADERVVYRNLDVSPPGGGGGAGGTGTDQINPQGAGRIALTGQSAVGGGGDSTVQLTFENSTFNSSRVNVTDARVSYYLRGGSRNAPEQMSVTIYPAGDPANATDLTVGDRLLPLDHEISLNEGTTDVTLAFGSKVYKEDFYVLTLQFDNGDTYTYFVSHPK
jgi:hypothetical protein